MQGQLKSEVIMKAKIINKELSATVKYYVVTVEVDTKEKTHVLSKTITENYDENIGYHDINIENDWEWETKKPTDKKLIDKIEFVANDVLAEMDIDIAEDVHESKPRGDAL
jgi:hypothetical protein